MPKYLIEREMPGFGSLTPEELREELRKSREITVGMGPDIQWLHSYITGDRVYCIYYALNEELFREHSRRAGRPFDKVLEIKTIADVSLAEAV